MYFEALRKKIKHCYLKFRRKKVRRPNKSIDALLRLSRDERIIKLSKNTQDGRVRRIMQSHGTAVTED